MGLLVSHEIALKCSHLALVKERTVRTAPEIQEVVDGIFLLGWVAVLLEGGTNLHAGIVHQVATAVFMTRIDFYLFQGTICIERTGSMEEQVVVEDGIHAAMLQHHPDMLVQLFADFERVVQFLHQYRFFFRETVWVFRVDGREVAGTHLVFLAVDFYRTLFIIDVFEEASAVHLPFRMLLDELTLNLELDDGYRLMHLCRKSGSLVVKTGSATAQLRQELGARIIIVGLHGEGGKRNEVNAVAFL